MEIPKQPDLFGRIKIKEPNRKMNINYRSQSAIDCVNSIKKKILDLGFYNIPLDQKISILRNQSKAQRFIETLDQDEKQKFMVKKKLLEVLEPLEEDDKRLQDLIAAAIIKGGNHENYKRRRSTRLGSYLMRNFKTNIQKDKPNEDNFKKKNTIKVVIREERESLNSDRINHKGLKMTKDINLIKNLKVNLNSKINNLDQPKKPSIFSFFKNSNNLIMKEEEKMNHKQEVIPLIKTGLNELKNVSLKSRNKISNDSSRQHFSSVDYGEKNVNSISGDKIKLVKDPSQVSLYSTRYSMFNKTKYSGFNNSNLSNMPDSKLYLARNKVQDLLFSEGKCKKKTHQRFNSTIY
jgi:hypothetical protein